MKNNFDIRKFLTENKLTTTSRLQINLLKEEEGKGIKFNTKSHKITGAAPNDDKKPKIPPPPDSYILGPTQLKILKNYNPPGSIAVSPGARIANGTLYILLSMIPDLEGKRGRGGKYNVRDHIKASYGKENSFEAMEVLKALNYAILNSSEKSIQLPGKKGGEKTMLNYKAIPGKAVEGGYEIPAAPKKEPMEEAKWGDTHHLPSPDIQPDGYTVGTLYYYTSNEASDSQYRPDYNPIYRIKSIKNGKVEAIDEKEKYIDSPSTGELNDYIKSGEVRLKTNNLNENKTMEDNFDLRAYISSKRMLTENFEPVEDEDYESLERQGEYGVNPETGKGKELYEDDNENNLMSYNKVLELAKKAADIVPDAKFALIELAINRGKEEGVSIQDIEEVLGEYDMSINYLENPDEDNFDYIPNHNSDNDELESLDENQEEEDDEEIDDSGWYGSDEDDEEIEFGDELDKYELPDEFEWEDSYLEESIEDDETDDEEIDDSEWYSDEEDNEMEFGDELDNLELPGKFGWEDDF